MPHSAKRIALWHGQDFGYSRDVLRGIKLYAVEKPDWVFHDAPPEIASFPALREWRPHGVLAHLYLKEPADALARLRCPVVNTTSTLEDRRFALVEVDHAAVGRMAAEYFLDKGYKHFGYYGSGSTHVSRVRESAFRARLAEAGLDASSSYAEYLPRPPIDASWRQTDRRVRKWLEGLPKPVAIFSSNDVPARDLADVCLRIGLKVPDQAALLGVDNDEFECGLARPPLSSVQLPAERIGYEAAAMLDRMLSGEDSAVRELWLPPVRVVERESTDAGAIEDDELQRALAFIRDNLHRNIGVDTVCRHVGIGRRALERKMARLLGRSALHEIQRVRIEAVKRLLLTTEMSMAGIARNTGFSSARRMAVVFRAATSQTPSDYRRANLRPRDPE